REGADSMAMKPMARFLAGALPLVAVACGGSQPTAPPPTQAPAAPASTAAAPASAGSATLSGKVTFEGTAPAAEKVKLTADPKCAAMHKDGLERQTIKVTDGGLADVLVYVKSGAAAGTAPAEPVLLDQKGCDYTPHMLAMVAGQKIRIRNSDDTLHNIHPRPKDNAEFNVGQPRQGMESEKSFDKPEMLIPVGCDVHPWMRAYISVLSHPYFAVTADDGTFTIKGLPAGEYEIEAIHAKLGKEKAVSGKVTVKDGEAGKLDLALKG
ncbi:MAG TPA: carboxypeptidase regulatory-like domain-containing protein, partial [Vicinamibacteria bacterium]|nr:carboxypeptidase regulatory-like domain-containing protein [Vicinamibacteria bacterium]